MFLGASRNQIRIFATNIPCGGVLIYGFIMSDQLERSLGAKLPTYAESKSDLLRAISGLIIASINAVQLSNLVDNVHFYRRRLAAPA